MPAETTILTAQTAHERLVAALRTLQRAEKSAVLCFAEIHRRRLHRDLGYSSMRQYAVEALGFSPARCSQFLRLTASLAPQLVALALPDGQPPALPSRVNY